MDDIYQINVAKTELREAYRAGDVEALLSVFHPAGFVDTSDSIPSEFGEASLAAFRERMTALFGEYRVKLDVIIIDIVVLGDAAYDFGWHEFTLIPKTGGETLRRRQRYFELWRKDSQGSWKISFFMNNADVRQEFRGTVSSWFKGEGLVSSQAFV